MKEKTVGLAVLRMEGPVRGCAVFFNERRPLASRTPRPAAMKRK